MPDQPVAGRATSFRGPDSLSDGVAAELLADRIIMIGALDGDAVEAVTASLLMLGRLSPGTEISLYINSGGGSVESALAIHDTMDLVACPISTVCLGSATGGAVLLVAAGEPGRRATLPSSRFHLVRPHGEFEGSASEATTFAAEAIRAQDLVIQLFSRHCHQSPEEVADALGGGRFFSAREAIAWGLVDKVIERPPKAFRGIIK